MTAGQFLCHRDRKMCQLMLSCRKYSGSINGYLCTIIMYDKDTPAEAWEILVELDDGYYFFSEEPPEGYVGGEGYEC